MGEPNGGRSMGGKKYRRVKRVLNHANPLFDQWLREWQEEAQKRGSNMKYNFQRARKSLSLFPLPLYAGKDCKVLANFGDKLCQMLDRRLEEHQLQNGPVDWDAIHKVRDEGGPRKTAKRRKRGGGLTTSTPRAASTTTTTATTTTTPPVRHIKKVGESSKGKRGREYVPAVRSGAYAVMLTLYNAAQEVGYKGYMNKVELIEIAQPLSDASLTQASEGSHYTAWSSISTLIKKGLVHRYSNPAKYNLTPEGEVLAVKIMRAESTLNSDLMASPVLPPASPIVHSASPHPSHSSPTFPNLHQASTTLPRSPPTFHHRTTTAPRPCPRVINSKRSQLGPSVHTLSDSSDDEPCIIEKSISENPGTSFVLNEADESIGSTREEEISNREDINGGDEESLVVMISDDEEEKETVMLPSLPIFKTSDSSTTSSSQQSSSQRVPGMLQFCYVTSLGQDTPLKDRAAVMVEDDGFLGFLVKTYSSHLSDPALASHTRPDNTRPAAPGVVYVYLSNEKCPEISPGIHTPSPQPTASTQHKLPKCKAKSVSEEPEGTVNTRANKPPNKSKKKTVKESENFASLSAPETVYSDVPQTTTPTSSSAPLFTLLPGQYEIILCVDNRETSGKQSDGGRKATGQQMNKDMIISELGHHGVKYDVRKLNVGDFLWLCRDLTLCGSSGVREVVLPYIVERKRMDDLASSIKDGRFREQKFRLREGGWGASRPIYLVEEYGSQYLSLPETTCQQAVVNTQVGDRFTVKMTKDQRESAAYLTIMTRCLQSKYRGKSVYGMRREDLTTEAAKGSNWDPTPQTCLPIFTEFNASCAKNQQLIVREMLAKQLLQMHSLSVAKVRAIVDEYGTPSALVSALEKLGEGKQENLLASLKCGKVGRSLGQTISANVARLYTRDKLQ